MKQAAGRIARIVMVGLVGTIGLVVLLLAPDMIRLILGLTPYWLRLWWVEALTFILLVMYFTIRWFAETEVRAERVAKLARLALERADFVVEWAWSGGLGLMVSLVCFVFLIGWVPHYLTWPFSRDEDTFAVLAMSWNRGILPYRDIKAYNFPGEIYVFWVLGKLSGWGRTVPFYAFDAGCVVLLGAALAVWSKRRLGGALPGLIAYLGFLGFYLNMTFDMTGERDWHTALLVCVGIMAAQAWPCRLSRIVSAFTTALALAIRPHAILFLPALAAAVAEPRPNSEPVPNKTTRVVVEWFLWLSILLAMVFAPVVWAGIADDWLRGLRVPIYGGPYSTATPTGSIMVFLDQLRDWRVDVALAATLLLAATSKGTVARMAMTWSLAWIGVLLYRPLHPVQHGYLVHPTLLVGSITWALVVFCIISLRWFAQPVIVAAVALAAYELVPLPPWMCSFGTSVLAVRSLARGEMPERPPLGCLHAFAGPSRWNDYCAVLGYLRQATGPETFVANVLNRFPWESLNGPTGRLSPFRAESGICWLSWVRINLDPEFARELESTTDAVAVWDPRQNEVDPAMHLDQVVAVIRKHFQPEARFGNVEVWRRNPAGSDRPTGR
jgi:hypothetical protein